MMMAWLGGKFLGVARGWFVLLGLVLAILAVWLWIAAAERADDERNREIGATAEREAAQERTLERVETANEAREEINRNDDAGARLRYDQCLRSARTPANCERLLPERPADQR